MAWPLRQWDSEVDDFLNEVTERKAIAHISAWLTKLGEAGPNLNRRMKMLGDGLYELKPDFNGMAYRCLYGFHDGAVVIVVCFIKKKGRDQHKIRLARQRLMQIKNNKMRLSDVTFH